jgi:hypothetical protein
MIDIKPSGSDERYYNQVRMKIQVGVTRKGCISNLQCPMAATMYQAKMKVGVT